MQEQKPKFKVGQVFTATKNNSKEPGTKYTIKAVHQETEYPSGKHVQFIYKIEMTIFFKSGPDTTMFKKSEKGLIELLKPEIKNWYSIDCE